jgi:uncharacterized membrane protein YfcA
LSGQGRRILPLAIASVVGSLIGVALILSSSQRAFENIVPFLVLATCALLAAQPTVARRLGERSGTRDRPGFGALAAQTLVAAYGGYFSAAMGVAVLAILGLYFEDTLQRLNALKALLQLVIGAVSAIGYALVTPVDWTAVGIITPAGLIGGEVGAPRPEGKRPRAARGDRRLWGSRCRMALPALGPGDHMKISSGSSALTSRLGTSTVWLMRRSTATLHSA